MIRNDVAETAVHNIMARKSDYYRIALSFCGNRDDSLDAVSEMTAIVMRKYGTLRDPESFTGWSVQILVNVCRKYLRRRKREFYLEDMGTEIADTGGVEELSSDLRIALDAIKPAFREVIVLKELMGYSYREIAGMLRIPVGTVQSRHHNGLLRMREKLGGTYHEES